MTAIASALPSSWLLYASCGFAFAASVLAAPISLAALRVGMVRVRAKAGDAKAAHTQKGRVLFALVGFLPGAIGEGRLTHLRPVPAAREGDVRLVARLIEQAGLQEYLDVRTALRARPVSSLLFALAFCLVGSMLSGALGLLCAFFGAYAGWRFPQQAILAEAKYMQASCRDGLPQMLDIVALASRAGLGIDRALELYASGFNTPLAKQISDCVRSYMKGAESREQALQACASRLDLPEMAQFCEAVQRSTRFGVPLAQGVEQLAELCRKESHAQMSERVAKSPVKMLIPMGVLILPSMLILVMGPILMNMLSGMG